MTAIDFYCAPHPDLGAGHKVWGAVIYEQMDDAELLARASRGDADAFAAFYRRHLPRVLAFGVRLTGDPELAADLCGEVFAAALSGCARYEPGHDTALPWLLPAPAARWPGRPRPRNRAG